MAHDLEALRLLRYRSVNRDEEELVWGVREAHAPRCIHLLDGTLAEHVNSADAPAVAGRRPQVGERVLVPITEARIPAIAHRNAVRVQRQGGAGDLAQQDLSGAIEHLLRREMEIGAVELRVVTPDFAQEQGWTPTEAGSPDVQ